MFFESRSLWHPKSLEFADEYEDAYAVGGQVAAVADGVSSAIFCDEWARILTSAVADRPPDLTDSDGFRAWLAERRSQWRQSIDLTKLDWARRQKLQQVGGAYCTLLWAEFSPWRDENDLPGEDASAQFLLRCFAVGDSCLFHVRDGQLLHKFPLETVAQFAEDPITICSVNRNRDHLLEFQTLEAICRAGDFVFLTSDALAKWIYLALEGDEPVDWPGFWNLTPDAWNRLVAELRDRPPGRRMRVDDTTLIMLRLGEPAALEEPPTATIVVPALPDEIAGTQEPEQLQVTPVAGSPTAEETNVPMAVGETADGAAQPAAEVEMPGTPEPESPDKGEESIRGDDDTADGMPSVDAGESTDSKNGNDEP